MEKLLTLEEVAEHCAVDRDTVSRWIANRELIATNVAKKKNAKRPTWRVRHADLESFELSRRTVSPLPRQVRNKKADQDLVRKWFPQS